MSNWKDRHFLDVRIERAEWEQNDVLLCMPPEWSGAKQPT